MSSKAKKFLVVASVAIMSVVMAPAANSAASTSMPAGQEPIFVAAWHKGHVNSTGSTRLFVGSGGESYYGWLAPCTNFYYDAVINGRYRTDLGGYVSTDKAGPGWCGD